ncbi:putative membrane protein [Conyzicola lurida]|uniref:Putative membrane protein n=1 Tax=Conyzicola lurida TaxID=1172621 RepID=A0A841AKK8_9MICO|nr:hypothetical protein [Conyzicola lurida]MBB5844460.1 putative membrane protein [Conyzicola lurida]
MITTPTTRSYASGLGGRIGAFVVGVLAVPLVGIGFPLLVLNNWLDIRDSKILIAVCVSILVIGWLWVLVHVFVTGPIKFETDAATVRLRRGLRVTNEWSRAGTVFSSLVVRNSTNGIPSGSTRTLIAVTPTERVEVPARWFSASAFNDLMADVAPVSAMPAPDVPSVTTRDFTLDPRATRLSPVPRVIVTVLIVGFVVALAIAAYFIATEPSADVEALYFIAAIALFTVIVVAIVYVSGRRRASKIPSRIAVTGSTIQVDGRATYFAQLQTVELTPPGYSGNFRSMTLVEKTGQRTTYALGAGSTARTSVFPDYAEFVDLLGRVAPAGLVRFDLR